MYKATLQVKQKHTIESLKTAKNMMENTTPEGLIKWKKKLQ